MKALKEYLVESTFKFKKIEDHRVLSTLRVIIEAIERGYYKLGKFPDVAWLKLNFIFLTMSP